MTLTGECFCGTIKYEVRAPLRDARSCHRSRCRKAFSSAASAYALVDAEQFAWTAGEETLSSYEAAPGWGLAFCSVCGSTLCGMHRGTVHGITLGTLNGDPKVALQRHIYVGSKAPWDEIGGDCPQYDEGPPESQ